jgi:spermidine synthase/MFS family permease
MLTGFGSLIFEVVWIRLLSDIFGTTIHATATSLAGFLGGLGIGAFLIGKYIDRHDLNFRALLIAFAICELAAAILGLLLCLLLPHLHVIGALVDYGSSGAATIVRVVVTFALLFVPTFFMGGSLPILSKALLMVSPQAGRTVGALYAINTLGGALGAVLVDAWLIINHGLIRTAGIAAAGNLVAVFLVFGFLQQPSPRSAVPKPRSPSDEPPHGPLLLGVYALSGFCALAYEVVWVRVLLGEVFSSRFAISTMVGVVLLGLVAGAGLAAVLIRRRTNVIGLLGVLQAFVGISALASLYVLESLSTRLRAVAETWVNKVINLDLAGLNLVGVADCLPQVLVLQAVPATLLGAVLPLVAEGVVSGSKQAGHSVGRVYLWNTLGAIGGATVAGFLLLPNVGMEGSVQLLATINVLLAIVLLSFAASTRRKALAVLCAAGVLVLLFVLPKNGFITRKEAKALPRLIPNLEGETIYLGEGLYETLAVREYGFLGAPAERLLMTNFYSMSGISTASNRYMRLMAHIPLLLRDDPQRVAAIAFGVGNTARAAAAHPVAHIDVIDISEDILRLSPYFSAANLNVLEDHRVDKHVMDGRNFLLGTSHKYDLITFEPPPPGQADVVGLYTKEYYELVRNRLTPRGLVTQWIPIIQTGYTTNLSMIRTFVEVFPYVTLWTGALNELIVCAGVEPMELDTNALNRRISERSLHSELAEIGAGDAESVFAAYLGGKKWLEDLTRNVPAITDDNRLLEYDYARKATEPSTISDYFNFYRSGDFVPGIDRHSQDDMRQICIWRLQQLMGTLNTSEFAERILVMTKEIQNLYLADIMFGLPRSVQHLVGDPSWQGRLLDNRAILPSAVWHHLLRNEFDEAGRLAQSGLDRWPGDPRLEQLRTWIRARSPVGG